jgi:hypothetical protein
MDTDVAEGPPIMSLGKNMEMEEAGFCDVLVALYRNIWRHAASLLKWQCF